MTWFFLLDDTSSQDAILSSFVINANNKMNDHTKSENHEIINNLSNEPKDSGINKMKQNQITSQITTQDLTQDTNQNAVQSTDQSAIQSTDQSNQSNQSNQSINKQETQSNSDLVFEKCKTSSPCYLCPQDLSSLQTEIKDICSKSKYYRKFQCLESSSSSDWITKFDTCEPVIKYSETDSITFLIYFIVIGIIFFVTAFLFWRRRSKLQKDQELRYSRLVNSTSTNIELHDKIM